MKAFLSAFGALLIVQDAAFSQQTAVLDTQKAQIAQIEAEHAQAIKDYPAWLVKVIAAEFAAVLEAGNHYLAAPSQKNLELYRAAKKDQLQRAGVHICKFADASQLIADAEREKLGEQLAEMMDAFTKNEKALAARMDGVVAQQQQRQEVAQGEMPGDTAALKK